MNLRGKIYKEKTYIEYITQLTKNVSCINSLLAIPAPPKRNVPIFIMDFIIDARTSLERILGCKLSWAEYDNLFNHLFSSITAKLKRLDSFKNLTTGESDVTIYLEIGRLLEIDIPDRFLAQILKDSRNKDTQCDNESKTDILDAKQFHTDMINEMTKKFIKRKYMTDTDINSVPNSNWLN